jgi:hypothetical protein
MRIIGAVVFALVADAAPRRDDGPLIERKRAQLKTISGCTLYTAQQPVRLPHLLRQQGGQFGGRASRYRYSGIPYVPKLITTT